MADLATAERLRQLIDDAPAGTFLHSRDLVEACAPEAHRAAVDAAMLRLVDELPLVRMRRGLYYKGKPTRFGVTRPDQLTVAYEVCKERGYELGFGPAGYTAARTFGLTTQVPGVDEVAVPGRCPSDLPTVHFTSRSASSRTGLFPTEVALLEVLREWDRFSERGWDALVTAVASYVDARKVRLPQFRAAALRERHLGARELTGKLLSSLPSPVQAR